MRSWKGLFIQGINSEHQNEQKSPLLPEVCLGAPELSSSLDAQRVSHLSRVFSIGLEQTGSVPLVTFPGHTQAVPLTWSPEEKQSLAQVE